VQYFNQHGGGLDDVIARCELRHHAAVLAMLFDLRVEALPDLPGLTVVNRDTGLVTGTFDT
jgi:hypothetical protein